jgi:hypothetical protein
MVLKRLAAAPVIMLVLALGACNTVSDLTYAPTIAVQQSGVPTVASVTATDQRKEDPTRLATVMGTFGNPLKTLDTAKPVKDEVAGASLPGSKRVACSRPADRRLSVSTWLCGNSTRI